MPPPYSKPPVNSKPPNAAKPPVNSKPPVVTKAPLQSKPPAQSKPPVVAKPTPEPKAAPPKKVLRCDVVADDLKQLDVLHRILRLLNEPRESAAPLARMIQDFPVLEARVRAAYRPPHGHAERGYDDGDITSVLVRIGNRGFETVLLQLLEDLTMLSSEIGDP